MNQNIKEEDINQFIESVILSFFCNNSRLINAATEVFEHIKKYEILNSKTMEYKDGIVCAENGSFSIYGYCLGTYVQLTHYSHTNNLYEIDIANDQPLIGILDLDYFKLSASNIEILEDKNRTISVKFTNENSFNNFEGSLILFKKWLAKALDNRFPMSKSKNPISRFLY